MHAVLREQQISMPQMGTLHVLRAEGPQSIGSVAESIGLSLAATSHLIERLVQREFVTRTEDPRDRRQKRVELSPAGASLVEGLQQRAIAGFDDLLAQLPRELRRRLETDVDEALALLAPARLGCG
ncbi:MAG: MarR family transcriptional regulator [Trueperaceae bacterium]